jgi:tetratricopeptide (TPR) repeat protein
MMSGRIKPEGFIRFFFGKGLNEGGSMKKFFVLTVAACIAVFVSGCENDADLTPDQVVEKYSQRIKSNPRDAAAYGKRAAAYYFDLGKYDLAFEDADKALSLNPKDDKALAIRGQTYRLKKDYDRAVQDFEAAIRLNPKNAEALRGRGQVYMEQDDLDKALAEFTKSLEADPNYYRSYVRRGDAYLSKKDYDNALEDYNRAVELNPNYAEAYNQRGNAYYAKGQHDPAMADYKKTLEIDPDNYPGAYYMLGGIHQIKSDYYAAIGYYTKAIELEPDFADYYFNRGVAYLNTNDNDKAIQDYNRALELQPDNSGAYNNRGNAYLNTADYAKALADYNKALKLDPKNEIAAGNIKRVAAVRAENQRKAEEERREKQRQAAKAQREKYLAQFPSVTDVELLRDYDNNEIAARQRWQGKRILVSGKIISIDEYSGVLVPHTDLHITFMPGLFSGKIECYFAENNRNALSGLSRGSEIRILGIVGRHNTMIGGNIRLELRNCSVEPW